MYQLKAVSTEGSGSFSMQMSDKLQFVVQVRQAKACRTSKLTHHSTEGFTPFSCGQYVAKNNCTKRISDGKEWERTGTSIFPSVAATFEKAITYVFSGKLIRHAEARGSIPF